MSLGPLMSLPGKMTTLLSRLTSGRATLLDNLDAAVTTRAASATALSSATWTSARAGYIDLLNTHLDADTGIMERKWQLMTSGTTWTRPAAHVGDTVWLSAVAGGGSGANGSDGWGGNGGEYICDIPYTVSGNVTYSIGAGGAAKGTAGSGNAGGDTTFGTVTLEGGSGGSSSGSTSRNVIGGTMGGRGDSAWELGQSNPCAKGGAWGSNDWNSGGGGGGGGMILDGTQIIAGDGNGGLTRGGKGYGAGGGADGTTSGAGAAGAILVEWWEYT